MENTEWKVNGRNVRSCLYFWESINELLLLHSFAQYCECKTLYFCKCKFVKMHHVDQFGHLSGILLHSRARNLQASSLTLKIRPLLHMPPQTTLDLPLAKLGKN